MAFSLEDYYNVTGNKAGPSGLPDVKYQPKYQTGTNLTPGNTMFSSGLPNLQKLFDNVKPQDKVAPVGIPGASQGSDGADNTPTAQGLNPNNPISGTHIGSAQYDYDYNWNMGLPAILAGNVPMALTGISATKQEPTPDVPAPPVTAPGVTNPTGSGATGQVGLQDPGKMLSKTEWTELTGSTSHKRYVGYKSQWSADTKEFAQGSDAASGWGGDDFESQDLGGLNTGEDFESGWGDGSDGGVGAGGGVGGHDRGTGAASGA